MSYRDLLNDAVASIFAEDALGVAATYNGDAVTVLFNEIGDPNDTGRQKQAAVAEVKVLRSQVPAWERKDELVIGGETWLVIRQLAATDSCFKLQVERDRRVNL